MATLVFDIETSALPLESFDDSQREFLFREAARIRDQEESDRRRLEIGQWMNLWPLTAQVVCIGMVNADTDRGQVLFLADDAGSVEEGDAGSVTFLPCAEEAELLEHFWAIAPKYDRIVSFNGRGFDVPFIYLRSALLNVPITRKDWLGYRYQSEPHCDLAEQLTFYGVSGRDGAARRFNLDFYCRAFGIESPKAQGISGVDVSTLLAEGRHREIAEYCVRDVRATVLLYHVWRERLGGVR